MEAMHAREHIELLSKESLKTFFTFMTGLYLNTSILNHS